MRDILAIGMGLVMACLALILTPYSIFWWIFLLVGSALALVAGCRLLFEYFRPKKLPQLICTFSTTDIGGCVCPNTGLKRAITVTKLPQANQTWSATSWYFEPAGTVGLVGLNSLSRPEHLPVDRGTYYRIKVTAKNYSALQCKGRLESLKFGSKRLIAESIDLPFAPAGNADALNKTIHADSSEHLDFLFISDANTVELTPPGFVGPSAVDWRSLFDAIGDYTLEIRVFSPAPDVQAAITVLFHWTGNRATSRIVGMH